MSGSSVLVALNALALKRLRLPDATGEAELGEQPAPARRLDPDRPIVKKSRPCCR